MAARNRRPSLARLRSACATFNSVHPVGTMVRYWTGLRGDGPGKTGEVLEPGAYVLGGHTPVVFIAGCSGCVALSHVAGDH